MPSAQVEHLRGYINNCRSLKRELELAISDMHFSAKRGSKIHYAIDFSEIYAYAIPSQGFDEFRLFPDDPDQSAALRQQTALNRLFHHMPDQLILLKPYAVELQNFIIRGYQGAFDELLKQLPDVIRASEELLKSPEFARIIHLSRELENSGREMHRDEQELFIEFIKRYAWQILTFIEQQDIKPIRLVKNLFSMKRLKDIETIVELDWDIDPKIVEKWGIGLYNLRQDRRARTAAYLDAVAIATIKLANETLRSQNTKILLVTRSPTMHMLLGSELEGLSPLYSEDYILRHPRVFSLLYAIENTPLDFGIQQLEDRLKTIELFLTSVEQVDLQKLDSPQSMTSINPLISRIRDEWEVITVLEASLGEALLDPRKDKGIANRREEDLLRFLRLLQDHEELRGLIFNRIERLAEELNREHELLGVYFQSLSPSEQDILEAHLRGQTFSKKSVLRSTKQAMPHTLQFYSSEAQELLDLLRASNQNTYRWTDVLEFLSEGFKAESGYERLLAMAYFLGTLSRWNLAEIYCKRAIDIAEEREHVSPHEACFFLAICLRKHERSVDRHKQAISALDKAIKLKRDPESDANDPRYLAEKGTQILMLHLDFRNQIDNSALSDRYGLKLLDKAEKEIKDDRQLRVYIVNNRLFYHIETEQLEDIQILRDDYKLLTVTQKEIEPEMKDWSPAVLDTVAWAQWHLYPRTPDSREEIIDMLNLALESSDLERIERKNIRRHLDIVKSIVV